MSSIPTVGIPQNSMEEPRLQTSEPQYDKFSNPSTFLMLANKIQDPGMPMFRFSLDGRWSGRSKNIALIQGYTHFQDARIAPFVAPGLSTSFPSSPSLTSPTSSSQEAEHPASARSEGIGDELRGHSEHGSEEIEKKKTIETMTTKLYGYSRCLLNCPNGNRTSGKTCLVDDSVPEHRDASSSCRELPMEPRAKVVPGLGKHSIYTHFPKDRKLWYLLENQKYKELLQKTYGTVGRVENIAISLWKGFSKLRDAGREDCLCSEQDHTEFPVQEEGQPRGTKNPKKRTGLFLQGRQIAFMIYDYFRVRGAHVTQLDYADLFSVTLRDDRIQEFVSRWDEVLSSMSKNSIRWNLGKSVQTENTWAWSTQNRLRIVRHGDSSEDVGSKLSKV